MLFWKGVGLQFFLVTILPLTILLLVVAFGSQSLHQHAMHALVGDRDLRTIRAAARTVDRELTYRAKLLELLAYQSAPILDLNNTTSGIAEVTSLFESGIAVFSPTGDLILQTGPDQDWARLYRLHIAEWLASQQSQIQMLSNVYYLPDEVIAGIAVRNPKNLVIFGLFSARLLIQESLEGIVNPEQSTIRVVSPTFSPNQPVQIIYQSGLESDLENIAAHPGIQEVMLGKSGVNYYPSKAGERVVAYSPIPQIGWGLVVEEDWETITNPILRTTQIAPLVLAPGLVLALFGLWFGARQIVQPLHRLEERTKALANESFDSIQESVGGIPEIQALQASLKEMAAKLQAAHQTLRMYIGSITTSVENERRNLARELHDDTIQAMIALNQRAQLAAMNESDPGQKSRLLELQQMIQQAMTNLRRTIQGLRPIYLEDLGLYTALEILVKETLQQNGLDISLARVGQAYRLSGDKEVMVYRIAQEALSNILRHAHATHARVKVFFQDHQFMLTIEDDGKGFSLPENLLTVAARGHFGLVGLFERAEALNGQLSIESAPGKGTVVSLCLPH